jgi:pimeloyl-ACP methyl ester carboxylesterase
VLVKRIGFIVVPMLFVASVLSPQSPVPEGAKPALVRVADREVEVVRSGRGAPTLVLESGAGEGAERWLPLVPELAKLTRVIAYSRAGFGKSTADTVPGSPQRSVSELHQLLDSLDARRPVVIVGHSWGGLLARLYVSTYPSEVAAVVLIDGTHEAQCARWFALNPAFDCVNLFRAAASSGSPSSADIMRQIADVQAAQRVDGMKPLPDIPVAVITAMKPCGLEGTWNCQDSRAITAWRTLHDEWAARSTSSLNIVSARTGHYVMNDQPELIVEAVKFVLNQVK